MKMNFSILLDATDHGNVVVLRSRSGYAVLTFNLVDGFLLVLLPLQI